MERDYVAEYQNSKQEPLIKGHANDCLCNDCYRELKNEYHYDISFNKNVVLALLSLLFPIIFIFYLYLLVIKTCRES